MDERMNELAPLNRDQELALAIERGEITKEEVERIWANTTDLSAQTSIEVRRAVLLMKQAGSFEKAWPIFYKEVMRQNSEIMAAFNRDESKFSHLVAGSEAIVKALQNINPLVERLKGIDLHITTLSSGMELINEKLDRILGKEQTIHVEDEPPLPEGVRRVDPDPDDYERDAEQARKDSIGSAWGK